MSLHKKSDTLTLRKIVIFSFLLIISTFNCHKFKINPVQVELVIINNNQMEANSQEFEKVFFDPYILYLNKTKKFVFNEKDIKNIEISEDDSSFYIQFYLKGKKIPLFHQFTLENMNSLIAVKINGKINSIARIDEIIDNGAIQFVANLATKDNVISFLKQFFL